MVYKIGAFLFLLLVVVHLNRSCAAKLPTGTGPSNQLSRIAYGWEVPILEHPYMVNMWIKSTSGKSRKFQCGGTLISETCILTAAHCLFDDNDRLLQEEEFEVYGGNNTRRKGILLSEVESVVLHDDYDDDTANNDVAIMKLAEPVEDFNIETIEIDYSKVNDGDTVTVAGWGLTEKIKYSENLREANIIVMNTKKCRSLYSSTPWKVTENMFCAIGLREEDSCYGDSGGPIIRNGKQIGIVSFGEQYACGKTDWPGIYTKLSSSRVSKFLRQTIADNC